MLAGVTSGGWLVGMDADVARFVARHREPWLTSCFEVVTWLGSSAVLVPVAVLAGAWLRHATPSWRPLLVLAAILAGAFGFSQLVKHAVDRERPAGSLVDTIGAAFPSGHAAFAAAGWLALAILFASVWPARRTALLAAAIVVITIVGVSRVYLAAHWTTDVLAGWTLGGLWLTLVLACAGVPAVRRATNG